LIQMTMKELWNKQKLCTKWMILFSFFREQTFTEDTRLVVEAMVSNRSLHRYNCFNPGSKWGKLYPFLCY
jgi:hypothetical protein